MVILLAGVLVFWPAVRAPLFLDDYLHAAMVEGTFAAPRGPFDLYDFVGDGDRQALLDRGLLPWWSHPQLTIRFLRPLSSALLWIDHRVFSHAALPMHLHSLAWWCIAALAVRAFFTRAFSPRVALLATAIFALSPCHALPLAWVANRETLVCLTFGALALSAYARFREERRALDGAVAFALFTFALLGGGEYALAFGGYVLAIELLRRERFGARAIGILPFAVPAAAYAVARTTLGYGARGSGFYSDPLREPIAFLATAPYRMLSMLADGWLTLGSDVYRPGWERWALAAFVLAAALFFALPIRGAIAALEPAPRATARWLLLGSIFALVPTLAVVPAFRLLGVSMIGVAAVCALVIERAWYSGSEERGRLASLGTLAALALAFAQLVHGPATAFLAARQHQKDGADFAERARWLRDRLGDPTKADVGIVRGMSGSFFAPFALEPRGRPPARWRVLAQAGHVLALRRDEKTLELVFAANRGVYPIGERNLYRDVRSPLRVGDVFQRAGMRVKILEVGEAGPRRVEFAFDDDPSSGVWLSDGFDGAIEVKLPEPDHGAPYDP